MESWRKEKGRQTKERRKWDNRSHKVCNHIDEGGSEETEAIIRVIRVGEHVHNIKDQSEWVDLWVHPNIAPKSRFIPVEGWRKGRRRETSQNQTQNRSATDTQESPRSTSKEAHPHCIQIAIYPGGMESWRKEKGRQTKERRKRDNQMTPN